MPTFSYTAKDTKGALVEGSMDAEARAAVVSRLQQMGYFPVNISTGPGAAKKPTTKPSVVPPKSSAPPSARTTKSVERAKLDAASAKESNSGFSFRRGISAGDINSFNRQMADLIGAGVPLVKALGILMKQSQSPQFRDVVRAVLDDVQGGSTFADALARHPKIFSRLYVAMVRSGEAGGMLDEVLNRLAEYSEQEEQLRGKILSALAYPAVMIIVGIVAVLFMFVFVIPKITATFAQMNQTLPAITQLLIAMSAWLQNYWYTLIIGIAIGATLIWQFVRTPEGRLFWHRTQLQLPILGPLMQKREVARFTRTLGSLLRNGVSILSALDIVREVVDNVVVKGEVDRLVDAITQGSNIATPLVDSRVFPPVAVNMIAIGEETGRLPEVMLRVSESFESQVDRAVRTATSLIEPLIIVIMGCVVAFIVIAMLLPIFSLDPSAGA